MTSTFSAAPAGVQGEANPASAAGQQPSLFDRPLRFDGSDYLPWRDDDRLGKQFWRVFLLMRDGVWRTPQDMEDATQDNWSSISAQLRHCRKERFGSHAVEKRYLGDGLYQYRLIENREWTGAIATRGNKKAGQCS